MHNNLTVGQKKILQYIQASFDIETLPDAVIATDKNFSIILWNKGAEKIYGYKQSEALGKKSIELIRSRPLNSTLIESRKLIRVQGTWEGEVIQYHKDGHRLYTSVSAKLIRNKNGSNVGNISFIRDITHQKQVEYNLRFLTASVKTLSSSLDYQTTLSKAAQLAVPRIADWCSIDLVNEKNELVRVAIAHRDPKKIKLADELRKISPPDLSQKTGLAKVINTGASEFYPSIPQDLVLKGAKSKLHLKLLKQIEFNAAIMVPITSSQSKKPIGAITFVSSESKRHYTKTDLQTAEKLAAQASFAIENARLYQNAELEIIERKKIEERLREMEDRKDNFISMASHELKTPITSLKIYTDLLERQLQKEEIPHFDKTLSVMKGQMNKLNVLIADLLNLSKIQAGKLELRMDIFDMVLLIQEIVEQIQPTSTHSIEIHCPKNMAVKGDRDRIGQVLINLITNAIKYSPEGDKVIISAVSDKIEVRVEVRDFGVGIDKKHSKKIFERFYQIETDKNTYPGLGMGLYISQEIVTRHDGKLWTEKAQGKGSLFIFTLPL